MVPKLNITKNIECVGQEEKNTSARESPYITYSKITLKEKEADF